jgi:deazaflavin-dependent oxidoreductase (nitroreductase family)
LARTNRPLIKFIATTHRCWYRSTGGLVGGRLGRARFLLLVTTGRKTGRRQTTPLTYIRHGDAYVVIGSNGGDDRHPAWWLNLRAGPRAEVQLGRRRVRVTASEATGDERARLWAEVTRSFPVYDRYRERTRREIPVVILTPEGEP